MWRGPSPDLRLADLADLNGLGEVDGPLSVEVIHRVADLSGLDAPTRMRLSGMAMRDLQHYVHLVEQGEATVGERLDMLLEHRDTIRRQIRELSLSLAATEYKIATCGGHTGDESIPGDGEPASRRR